MEESVGEVVAEEDALSDIGYGEYWDATKAVEEVVRTKLTELY
jgi:hypothetical protein